MSTKKRVTRPHSTTKAARPAGMQHMGEQLYEQLRQALLEQNPSPPQAR